MLCFYAYFVEEMMHIRFIFMFAALFFIPYLALAWGGPEHSSITAAAAAVLAPAALAFLGAETTRLIKAYCIMPDFSNAAYHGVCSQGKDGQARTPDQRRDLNVPYYCDYDSLTGAGEYFGHGPAIAFAGAALPLPDEHSTEMFENNRFCEAAVYKFLNRAQQAFLHNSYFDAIRFMGVAVHYLQDCTPPPHVMRVPNNDMELHHAMEAIEDHSRINLSGYQPRILGGTPEAAMNAARSLAIDISLESHRLAEEILALIQAGQRPAAASKTIAAANLAARATADVIHTFCSLNQGNMPQIPAARHGVNLLYNPSFDLDANRDLHPDGWVREWHDLACPRDMHLWDRVSTRGRGACVRLYRVSPAGAAWRTARSHGIPVAPGQTYALSGMIRLQCAGGSNYIALRFQNAGYETIAEFSSPALNGNAAWQPIRVAGAAPADAVDVLAVCASFDNPGSVLFDDLKLVLNEHGHRINA